MGGKLEAREYLGVENVEGKPTDQVGQISRERVRAEIVKQAATVRPFIQMEAERWVPGTGMGWRCLTRMSRTC